jgi:hypothetical protein
MPFISRGATKNQKEPAMSSIALMGLDDSSFSSSSSSSRDTVEVCVTRGVSPRRSASSATSSSDSQVDSSSVSSGEDFYRSVVVRGKYGWSRSSAAASAQPKSDVGSKANENAKVARSKAAPAKTKPKKQKKSKAAAVAKAPKQKTPIPAAAPALTKKTKKAAAKKTTKSKARRDDPRTDRIVLTKKERAAYEAALTAPLAAFTEERVVRDWNEGVRDPLVDYARSLDDRDLMRRANKLPTHSVGTERRLGERETALLEQEYTSAALRYIDRVVDATSDVTKSPAYIRLETDFEGAQLDVRREFDTMLARAADLERVALDSLARAHFEQNQLASLIKTNYARLDTLYNAIEARDLQRQLIDLRAAFTAGQAALRSKTINLRQILRRKYDLHAQRDGALAALWVQHAKDQREFGAQMIERDRRLGHALHALTEFRESTLGRNSNIRAGFRSDRIRSAARN